MTKNYKTISVKGDHPLRAPGCNYVYEHRVVLWEKIGPGTHPCHHCGIHVTWLPGEGARSGALVVDHLDHDRRNNDPSNLVPSCNPCNQGRQPRKNRVRDDELFIVADDGTRKRAVEVRCEECQKIFLALPRNVNPQRFCGRECSSKHARPKRAPYKTSRSIRDDELFIVNNVGDRVRAVAKNCESCGTEYLVVRSQSEKSRFCSRSCRSRENGRRSAKTKMAKTTKVDLLG
jgi:hypothetical protein